MTGLDSSGADPDRSTGARMALKLLNAAPGLADDAVAIVNGLFGDELEDRNSPIATTMTIRLGDRALPLDRDCMLHELADILPNPSSRICILVHGLMSTESIWRFPNDASTTYGTLLADDHDMTVLSLRYNTGRHISTNGREFAQLLNLLMRAWPVPCGRGQPDRTQHGRACCSIRMPLRASALAARATIADRSPLDEQTPAGRADRRSERRCRARGDSSTRPVLRCGLCPCRPLDSWGSGSTGAVPASRTCGSGRFTTRTGWSRIPTHAIAFMRIALTSCAEPISS